MPRLLEVAWLQILDVSILPHALRVFPDIRMLTRLRILSFRVCWRLELIPSLGELVALEYLKFNTLPCLKELPNMLGLTKLRKIELGQVPGLQCQMQLLNMVPSQLCYFIPMFGGPNGNLSSEKPSGDSFETVVHFDDLNWDPVDLHEWYRRPGATVIKEFNREFPFWHVRKELKPLFKRGFLL